MKIAIRADASLEMGTGHVMRCLTLANVLRERGASVRFVARSLPDSLSSLLEQNGHTMTLLEAASPEDAFVSGLHATAHAAWLGVDQTLDAEQTKRVLEETGPYDWVIVDHYGIDACWEQHVRECAGQILVIDDLADRRHDCDVLLDQNHYEGMEARYDGLVPEHCTRLLGIRYALLREEFITLRTEVSPREGDVRRLLIFFGGLDAGNVTGVTLDALSHLERNDIEIDAVIGAGHPARAAIETRCAEIGIRCHVQTRHMAELMAAADLAIGAGGTATWERCVLGLPAMVFCLAENQRKLVRDSSRAGLVYAPDIDPYDMEGQLLHLRALLGNAALRTHISRTALASIDGLGASRVAQHFGLGTVELRLAREDDSADLLAWRNAPQVRAVSNSTEPISEEAHGKWFASVLTNPYRRLLIGNRAAKPVGVVRFDLDGTGAEVSIYLAPGAAGQGNGKALLQAAERWLVNQHPEISMIRAEVLRDNAPSHRLFGHCGYVVQNTYYTKKVSS
jgi:UDP-2,4-diacetamido-2,4,6-trideoxy-beta-L-altropyranose hydrolase